MIAVSRAVVYAPRASSPVGFAYAVDVAPSSRALRFIIATNSVTFPDMSIARAFAASLAPPTIIA